MQSTTVNNQPPRRPSGGSGEMFDGIAERYDLLNRIISLGIDQSWRRRTVDALELDGESHALDVATGTADLALLSARRVPGCHVTGLDPSSKMLDVARYKVRDAHLEQHVELLQGDAEELPFSDDTFDGTTIAFGIRNVADRDRGLREMARVTKTSGRIAILELSEPRGGLMGPLARFHVHTVVPWVGALLSGEKEYRYLHKSIAAFPPAERFAEQMAQNGLEVLQVLPLTFGVAHLYVARPVETPHENGPRERDNPSRAADSPVRIRKGCEPTRHTLFIGKKWAKKRSRPPSPQRGGRRSARFETGTSLGHSD